MEFGYSRLVDRNSATAMKPIPKCLNVLSAPSSLLLGYGTYLALCVSMTEMNANGLAQPGAVIMLTEFYGVPIVIDPGYEFRVAVTSKGDVWREAVDAMIAAERSKEGKS